jgi:hypothetical protein
LRTPNLGPDLGCDLAATAKSVRFGSTPNPNSELPNQWHHAKTEGANLRLEDPVHLDV